MYLLLSPFPRLRSFCHTGGLCHCCSRLDCRSPRAAGLCVLCILLKNRKQIPASSASVCSMSDHRLGHTKSPGPLCCLRTNGAASTANGPSGCITQSVMPGTEGWQHPSTPDLVLSAQVPHPHQVLCSVLSLALAEGRIQLGCSVSGDPILWSLRPALPAKGPFQCLQGCPGPREKLHLGTQKADLSTTPSA